MVNTVKFSQFAAANINDSSTQTVGLSSGVNTIESKFYTWTIATRPATPFNGLLGLNTDIQQYEYWDSVAGKWQQILIDSAGINWTIITAVSQNAVPNNGYITNRSA